MIKQKSNLSVIVPVRWESRKLKHCLKSLIEWSKYDNEIIVIADDPTWETMKVLQEFGMEYTLVQVHNQYRNWDFGAQKATREYLMFIQADHIYSPHWDEHLLSRVTNNNLVGTIGVENHTSGRLSPIPYNNMYVDDTCNFSAEMFLKYYQDKSVNDIELSRELAGFVIHRDYYKEMLGFGYKPWALPHSHMMHEQALFRRIEKNGGQTWKVKNVIAYHYRPVPLLDDSATPGGGYPMIAANMPDWGWKYMPYGKDGYFWAGDLHCRKCDKVIDPAYVVSFSDDQRNKIMDDGYYECGC